MKYPRKTNLAACGAPYYAVAVGHQALPRILESHPAEGFAFDPASSAEKQEKITNFKKSVN